MPVADEEPDPPVQTFSAEARRIRLRAGVSVRDLAAEVGVKSDTIKVWETDSSESPWAIVHRARSAKYRRYVATLVRLDVADPPEEPEPQVVASAPAGKRRCRHAGCDTILSRFNEDDRCALHA